MIETKTEFTRTERLLFGPLFALFVGLVDLLLVRKFQLRLLSIGLTFAAAILILVYYLVPRWQTTIYRSWLLCFWPVGFVMSHVVLALVYYGVVTPIGLAMKLVRYDPLQRRLDRTSRSYWQVRQHERKPDDYFRQF